MQRDKDKRHSLSLLRKMHGIKFHQRFRIIFLFKSSSLYKIYNDDLSWNFSNLLESKNGNKTVDSEKNICHCSCASFFFFWIIATGKNAGTKVLCDSFLFEEKTHIDPLVRIQCSVTLYINKNNLRLVLYLDYKIYSDAK